jgi:thioredoxin-related protein
MKSVLFVHIMTRNILSYCNGLEKDGVKEKEYLNLLRREIKLFRILYKKWKRSLRPGSGDSSWGLNESLGF